MEEKSISKHREKDKGRVTLDYSVVPKISSLVFNTV